MDNQTSEKLLVYFVKKSYEHYSKECLSAEENIEKRLALGRSYKIGVY